MLSEAEPIRCFVKSTEQRDCCATLGVLAFIMRSVNVFCDAGTESLSKSRLIVK